MDFPRHVSDFVAIRHQDAADARDCRPVASSLFQRDLQLLEVVASSVGAAVASGVGRWHCPASTPHPLTVSESCYVGFRLALLFRYSFRLGRCRRPPVRWHRRKASPSARAKRPEPGESHWRRTSDGWESADTWFPHLPSYRPPSVATGLHPSLISGLLLLLSLGCLVAFESAERPAGFPDVGRYLGINLPENPRACTVPLCSPH